MSPRGPVVAAVATASPPHRVPQQELKAFARRTFARDVPGIDDLLAVFEHAGVEERQLACPLTWYEEPRAFPEKNEAYRRVALELAAAAAGEALRRARVAPGDVTALVFVSTTGISTPSLDCALIGALELPRNIARVPLWGLGCAGGAAGLARAAELARARGGAVLLVAVELCSVTFTHSDRSRSNVVATALFGDGAAAAVIAGDGDGPRLLAAHSHLVDDSRDVMGWALVDDGLQVIFAPCIPALVREVLPRVVRDAAAAARVDPDALEHLVLHPGGAKVLASCEDCLRVPPAKLQCAREVLRDHGNMSSPTILFVLERFLRTTPPGDALGLAAAFGPGFSAEGVVFAW
jgi:alkylresorcinol/alkylpyrone synthase